MNEITGWAAVGMAAVSNMAVWLKIIYDNKRQNGNTPGTAKTCIQRGEKIAKMETEQLNVKENIQEIKTDVKDIKKVVQNLK